FADRIVVPSAPPISQTTTAPLSFWKTMSALKSPLMSCMPFTCHDGSTVGRAATVLKTKVPAAKVGFFHSANVPLSFCHRMPALKSSLVSPVPTTCQVGPGFWMPANMPVIVGVDALVMVHNASDPLSFWKKISSAESALKSSSPTTCQVGPGFGSALTAATVAPCICQSTSAPLSFCHRMSESPLPNSSKSAAALKCQSGVTNGSAVRVVAVLLFISHIASFPALSRQRMSAKEPALLLKLKSER